MSGGGGEGGGRGGGGRVGGGGEGGGGVMKTGLEVIWWRGGSMRKGWGSCKRKWMSWKRTCVQGGSYGK